MSSTLDLQCFPIHRTASSLDPWDTLINANGGPSADWIIDAPGNQHEVFVCCLLVDSDLPRKKRLREEEESAFSGAPWAQYYNRIAIIVPVAVQDGIAMAQGILRLSKTCPSSEKGLGLRLLARVADHFRIEYLFLSPVHPFADHVNRELYVAGVPYGRYGARSMGRLLLDASKADAAKPSWLKIKETTLFHTEKDRFQSSVAVLLTIAPQPCPKFYMAYSGKLNGQEKLVVRSYISSAPPPQTRVLLLNERFSIQPEGGDPDYEPAPALPGAHDFLWDMAGNGLIVVHGPSLAAAFGK